MAEDWAAVSRAIITRMDELDLTQRELIDRSRVSKAIVGELQNNSVQRKRSDRTLEALSEALQWHPNHLKAVLNGHPLPRRDDPVVTSEKDIPGRLTVIENELRLINDRLERIDTANMRIDDVATDIKTAVDDLKASLRGRPVR
ncbi:MAG TPA: transcriptional regulator [Pseudonocardiaceae bacterium]|nr:transcriptional regulator [Pseudonocardiaceae bacterium]